MGFFERAFDYVNTYSWSLLFIVCILLVTDSISIQFLKVVIILIGVATVLEVILSGTWVWGSTRTNNVLMALFVNALMLLYFS